jgi:hypothetical protein
MRKQLGQMLIEAGAIDDAALQSALADQLRWGKPLGRTLVDLRLLDEEALVKVLGQQLGLPAIDLDKLSIPKPILDLVPIALINQHGLLPFATTGKFLDVAMTDPMNLGVIDELRIRTQLNIRPHLVGWQMLERSLGRYFPTSSAAANPSFEQRLGPRRGRSASRGPETISVDTPLSQTGPIQLEEASSLLPNEPRSRDREIDALQQRISKLEALVERDEAVLRKLLALLIDKGVATRDEIIERLG